MCIPVRCRCNSGYLTHILIGNANAYIRVNVVACRDDPAIAPGHRKRMKISSWESISVSNTAVLLNIVVVVLYGEIYSTPKPGAHEPHWTSMHAHWPSLCTYVTVGNRMANSSSVFIRNCMCNGLIPHCIQTYRDAYMERRWVCMVCVCAIHGWLSANTQMQLWLSVECRSGCWRSVWLRPATAIPVISFASCEDCLNVLR